MNHPRQRALIKVILVTAVLFSLILAQLIFQRHSQVAVAFAKGNQMLALGSQPALTLAPAEVAAHRPAAMQFVEAVLLNTAEGQPWHCPQFGCTLTTYYDFEANQTYNQIINVQSGELLAGWADSFARPPGTSHILPLALAAAAADPQVTAVLGDIGAAEPVMVPMSGWLADDDCAREWCVDLTFHSPAGDGRVFHVFVNLNQQKVARTFFTRGRPELNVSLPQPQRGAFQNDCIDDYDWQLCWEMTAHDGLNFTEATFQATPVFTSAKIPQIEAWYPSWPGGYRDEIGFNATVRPFGPTEVTDLGDGLEVKQLFTEFTRWPNCICCYRYEQIVRVYDTGSFEFRFISHGPGCDDLSIYRPFWRIELTGSQTPFRWQDTAWVPVENEIEIHPFVEPLSPEGYHLATQSDSQLYEWVMEKTDPLGLDEARVFILQKNENEGEGPVLTGPGDTFQPPRQWLNDDPTANQNVVIWYVPSLKTKKGGPWWCMPDPEPNINQCDAILRIDPISELHQPTAEELAARPTPTLRPTPLPTQPPAPTPTPRPIDGQTPAEIILNSGCGACHAIGDLGEKGKVGPDLSNIGQVAAERVPGQPAADYLRQSIIEPDAYISPQCPNGPCLPGIMPQDYANRLTPAQIETMITFLLTQIEPTPAPLTVIGEDTPPPATAVPKVPLSKTQVADSSTGIEPAIAVQLLLLGTVFLLTLFLVRQRPLDEESSGL